MKTIIFFTTLAMLTVLIAITTSSMTNDRIDIETMNFDAPPLEIPNNSRL